MVVAGPQSSFGLHEDNNSPCDRRQSHCDALHIPRFCAVTKLWSEEEISNLKMFLKSSLVFVFLLQLSTVVPDGTGMKIFLEIFFRICGQREAFLSRSVNWYLDTKSRWVENIFIHSCLKPRQSRNSSVKQREHLMF